MQETQTQHSNKGNSMRVSAPLWLGGLTAAVLLGGLGHSLADPGNDNRAPELPGPLSVLEVPPGNKVAFHVYAEGVQIYTATASPTDATHLVWTFKAPEAVLYDADGNVVGIHYAGPTWETESGSLVVGSRLMGVAPDPTAIPWLLLRAVTAEGPGVLARTTYIQRVATEGGLAPSTPPTQLGEEARVAYTAEYFFYRESN